MPMSITYKLAAIFLLLLLEGFASIAIEILTLRQLVPFAGSSVTLTSIVIGIFLLFLAIGYHAGGRHTAHHRYYLMRNFLVSALLTGITLSYQFVELYFSWVSTHIIDNTLLVTASFCLLTTAPIIYLLGQTIPITLNWFQDMRAGLAGGRVLFANTIGSCFGSVITTLILLHYFGVAVTILIVAFILSCLSLATCQNQEHRASVFVMLSVAGYFLYQINHAYEADYFIKTTPYANYRVEATPPLGKTLYSNLSSSSFITHNKKGFPYIELTKKILFKDLQLENKEILVLGAGGFSLNAESNYNNHFTYVDIDPALKEVVTEQFNPNIKGKIVTEDARVYLNQSKAQFDVIFVDTYSHLTNIPKHLVSAEFFSQVKNHLSESGYFVMNAIIKPTLSDRYSETINNTIQAIFQGCAVMPLYYSDTLGNVIFVCRNKTNKGYVYRDDKNNADFDLLALQ